MYHLFKLTPEGELEVIREEVALYEEFNVLLRRDRSSLGDAQGRKKLQFKKEWTYIYIMSDADSLPNREGWDEDEAHEYAVEVAGLPKGWEPDDEIIAANRRYAIDTRDVVKETRNSLLSCFKLYPILIEKMRVELRDKANKDKLDIDAIKVVLSLTKEVNELAKNFVKQANELKEALGKIDISQTKEVKRGGGEIEESMK